MFSRRPFSKLTSPQAWRQVYQIVGIIAAVVVVWFLFTALLSLFSAWFIVFLTIGLGVVVLFQGHRQNRRQLWLDAGCCGQCGYDLRSSPDICPECGRDRRLDEPTWRKLRREFEARQTTKTSEPAFAPSLPMNVPETPLLRPAPRRSVVDDGPIPLEGDE